MGAISQGRDLYKCLLLTAVGLTGMMIMPHQILAETVQEKLQDQEAKTIINHALSTWQNFMQDPEMSDFRAHLKEGHGVLIFPRLMKGAFVLGAEGGNGVLLVRHDRTRSWSEPVFYEISTASLGLQAGMETSEAILVIQTVNGIENLLNNTIKLGTDVSAAIGPKGGGIEGVTSVSIGMDFITYARAKGIYAGVSIEGASIGTRAELNKAYYGSAVRPSDIVVDRNVRPNPNSQVLHQAVVTGASGKGR